ncbi:sulfatase-like hydrolase/transferase [Novosphingobium sp. FSY-8]|uniref:Sulfatase-like hydrolase/transferase n=2 Tax=Novosphingobium ovatum TaxID=1908523 RepID=A0ABW9XEY9_9SPHN|nr:sulfatase-like hydrolase/transferase [Novosphingobium ovatum]
MAAAAMVLASVGITPALASPARRAPARPAASAVHPVLLISIDGLRPADVAQAAQRGLNLPNLRRFITQGASATGVVGVLPTVTYPSHTTLITGVAPARHGVVSNTTFDPTQINQEGWYWYTSDITRPTLWDAARRAGLTTANVHWPVSVGANVTYNLPQIWRTGHGDDDKLVANLSTPGLLAQIGAHEGHYAPGINEDIDGDETRGRYAARLIATHRPGFMTVYLTALDHNQHVHGPDSAPAHAVLERIDAIVGRLVAAHIAAHRNGVVAVVSDHGFAPVDTALNLYRPFIDAGLIRLSPPDATGAVKVAGWDAVPWPSGGSIAVVLARPTDAALQARVRDLLARLKADPASRIERVIESDAIAQGGGNPQAAFYVNLGNGVMAAPWRGPGMPMLFPSPYKGMHGYFPDDVRMRSTLLLMGAGVPQGRDLGVVDMRQIAPTIARLMGTHLPDAEAPAVPF